MAVHLTRIYTRTGDDGTTGLSDFSRVSKNDSRLSAYADCDEANAAIGVAVALGHPDQRILEVLRQIQNDLFDAGADLSTPVVESPEYPPLRIQQTYIDRLEMSATLAAKEDSGSNSRSTHSLTRTRASSNPTTRSPMHSTCALFDSTERSTEYGS